MKKDIPLAGAGGGGKQSSRTPYEAADNVASKTVASILDLLGEGVIGGLKNGEKSIFLDDVPVQNPDGSMNFKGVKTWERKGHQNQSPIDGFDDIETPRNVAAELRKDSPKTLSIDNDDTNRLRVIMEFPRLSSTDKSSGDINGASVQFEFALAVGADNFKPIAPVGFSSSVVTVSKKSSGKFQYEYLIDLPTGTKNRRVRVSRVTADSSNDYLQNKTILASYGEIVFAKMSYPNSALVGITIDSREFGGNLPRRSYLVGGILIRVPSNYDPVSNEYKGDWDGSFEYRSSSNPAWILYDLLIEKRYGLGSYISESMIDVGKIYQIGRYCDQYVPDGFGGMEKRFTINTVIATRQEAFKVINDIASVFRGMVFWAGGMINLRQDSPSSPVMQFSAANIIDKITRKGSARKDRPTVALITYNDKDDLYKQNVEYVEDEDAKKEHGIRKIESLAFGCTSRGQANRVGLWILYTSKMETDVVIFKAGIDSSLLMPGDLVKVQDKYRSGKRNSGRVVSCTKNSITLDSSVNLANQGAFITFLTPEGKMVDRDLLQAAGNHITVTFKSAIKDDEMPVSLGLWTITEPDLEPSLMRVISVKDEGKGVYEIMGVDHNPSKFAAIDQGAVLTPSKTTVLDPTYKKPENIQIEEATYISSPGNLSVKLLVSWDGFSPFYAIRYRRSDIIDNWHQLQLTDSQYEILSVPDKSSYDIEVFALSVTGKRTESISRTYKTVGTMTPPDAPKNLVAVGDYRQNIITWINPSSIDLEAVNVYGSKTNKIETATLLAKVPSTVFNHSGLEDDATWFYWVRAVNKRGMLSPANSNLGTKATTKEVMSFLKNKITETELSKDLLADINDNASDAAAEKVTAAVEVKVGEIKKAVDESKAASDKAVLDVTKNALSIDKEIAERKAAIKTLSDAAVSESQKRAEAIKKESDARVADIKKEATSRSDALKEESRLREESLKAESVARNTAILNEKTERGAAITASEKKSQTATDALATKVNSLSTATDANSAAIKKEEQARITADSSEAVERQSLASQMRGDYTGKDLTKVTAGLVFEERDARTSGDKAEASARQSLETRLGESVTAVNKSIESISTSQKAQSGEITAINTSLKNKAESSAVNSLNSKIEEQGKRLTSQGSAVTKLQNDLGLTNTSVGKKADSSALTALDSKVTQQGKDISSQSGSITALQNSLKTTNANVEKKADSSALSILDNKVIQQGKDISSTSNKTTALENSLKTTNENITKKADSSALTALDSKVVQQGKDISSVSGKTTALENSLKTTNANIGKKADSSALTALDSKVTQQGKDVSSANSSITRLSNTLKDMSVGGVNLFSESDSELGTVQESSNVGSAYSAVKYPGDNRVRNKTLIDSGKGIVISINADYEYFVTCFDKSSKYLGSGKSFSWRKDLLVIPPFLGFVGVVVRRSDGAKMSLLDVVKSRIKVEIGNVRTDWSPSPFDIASVNDVSNIKLANSKVISGLDSKVTQQGKDISSVSGKTTALENSLKVTNNNVGKKADAAALNSLNSTVDKQGKDITSHGKSITALDNSTSSIKSGLDDTEILARITTNGKQIIPVPNFNEGKNDVYLYNNANNGNISIDVIGRRSTNPTTSSHEIAMTVKGGANPNYGGFRRGVQSKPNAVFVTKYIIKLPLGWALQANTNPLGDGYIDKFVGNREGTGKYETYYRVTKCGEVGKFQTFGYVSAEIKDGKTAKEPTSASPMTWYLAQIEVYETTDYASATPEVTDFMSSAKTSLDSLTNATKSQSSQLTNLQNSLNTTNTNVGKKAESSALSALDSKVTQQGKDISSANSSITSLKSSILSRTVFLLKSAGAGSGIMGKITNDKGVVIATAARSYCLIVFKLNNDGSTVVESTKNYDVFANKDMGVALSKDVAALGNGKYAALITHDEPTGNRESILPAVERLGGTKETLYSFPYRGAYILAGRVGANKGDSIELASRTGNDKSAIVQTSIEFVNGVLMNHGNGGGIAILASTNANAISKLNTDTKATDGRVSSQSTQITKLQNDLNATNSNVSKKAESSALSSLDSKVTQQGKNIDSVSSKTTSLENGLKTTNTNVGKKADTSALNTLSSKVTDVEGKVKSAASSITSLSSKIDQVKNDLTNLIEVDLDLSKLDENIYYPVTLHLNTSTRYYFKVFRTLNQFSNNKPSYATHGTKTFSTILEWNVSGDGWGTQSANRVVQNFDYRFTSQSPILRPEQLTNNSIEYVYLRGGSFYKLTKSKICTHAIRTTKYTQSNQSVEPIAYKAEWIPIAVGKATSDAISKLSSDVTQHGKDITAQSTSLSQLTTKVNGQESTISTLNKTVTDSNKSQAETNKSVESKFNGYTARINQVEKTVASGGGLNATWMVKMEVRADGKKYASGIGLGIDGKTLQSQFLVQADRFALMNTANGKVTTPFVIDGGVTYINAASIKDGSIGSAKVGDLQSNNYAAGKTGWKFGKNGILEMNGQTSGQGRLSISNNRIDVYDEKGVLRVRLGLL
ncbi:phage tail protein [Moellerella wisconsensis]|uniref:phage tail tip fiber protein n=1 Tax=Moellerella wisconsensis TaxID=158849 RepID=UPI003076356D